MPRTKRPTKKSERVLEGGETLKKLDKIVAVQKKRIDDLAQREVRNIELAYKILIGSISKQYLSMTVGQLERINDLAQREVRNIELAYKILIGSISKQYLSMTVGQLRNELYLKEITNTTRRSRHSARPASHDDGYLTENSSQGSGERGKKHMAPPSTTSRSTSRRSRSADASTRKAAPSSRTATAQRRRSKSVYRTPAYNKNASTAYPAITPKVAPHTPLTVLRQPRQGEMVVSMTGSPVMVPTYSTMNQDQKANCNILLNDGTMLSLQPKQLRQSQAYIPFSLMDPGVLAQLRTLKDNLDKVVKLGEKNMK
ncbi:cell division cycle-associated protein 8 domain-containing protein [Phthorimaea operculella]|nr:cell division cycle-associated protein 8 domain-containing protein [Phthorimaea operculella]